MKVHKLTILNFIKGSGYTLSCSEAIYKKSIIVETAGLLTCTNTFGCTLDSPDLNSSKYYLLNVKEVGELITNEDPGYLYICTNNENVIKCSLVDKPGYYIDDNDLYLCTSSSNVQCRKSTKPPVEENCKGKMNGSVYYINNEYIVCINNDAESLSLEGKEYIITENSLDEIYEIDEDKYATIKASSMSVFVNSVTGKFILFFVFFFFFNIVINY